MKATMPIVAHHGNKLVFKRNGFTGWTSRGETGYYPPMYFMVKLDGDVICQVIDEIEVNSQTWRKVRDELASKAVLTAYD